MTPVGAKICAKCGLKKPLTDYYRHPNCAGGRFHICKICKCEEMRARALRNPESNRARAAAWAKANPERHRENMRRSYWKNVEKRRATNRSKSRARWYRDVLLSREKARIQNHKRYAKNPGYFISASTKHHRNNMRATVRRNAFWRKNNPEQWDEISARTSLSRRTCVPPKQWPESLVRAKTENLKLKRTICKLLKT